jgi:2-keto-4-pentenoate hydratase/2-oxohepta-3-ene-1,7-dioic acid hydratase in catechol pathway
MIFVALEGGIARIADDGSLAMLDADPDVDLGGFLARGGSLQRLAEARVRSRVDAGRVPSRCAISPRATIYGIGLNYRSKQIATGRALPEQPTLFIKATSALGQTDEPLALPSAAPHCVDYEGEIAVIINTSLHDADLATAASAIAGVLAANDVTARDVMRRTGNPSIAKSFPGFAQFGTAVLDPSEYGGIEALELTTSVNGEPRQKDRGDGMLMRPAELVALLSQYFQLRAGDVVLTGTPAGTGEESGSYLSPGDIVEVAVGELPALRTTIAPLDQRNEGA